METFKTWWKDLVNEYPYGKPTAEDIGRRLWKLTLKTSKEPVANVLCSVGLSSEALRKMARLATDEKKELFKKHEWVFNHKITPGDAKIIIEMYEKQKAR